ncbi:MAG TPA: glycosyltransferase family 39 protein [Blastocatellia bacterium]|nr:glycosyltransferase family 39 protein [Blastocatellia bacterium]
MNLPDFVKQSWRDHRRFVLFFTIVALIIRLYLVAVFPHIGGDTIVYEKLANDIIATHTFSISDSAPYVPNDIRTPGYPLFIAAIYVVFRHHETPIRLAQVLLDILTCFLIAMIVLAIAPDPNRMRMALLAFAIATVCPFLANYTASILSETLTIFLTTLALFFCINALKRGGVRYWLLSGITCGLTILVRPDSVLLAAAIGITLLVALFAKKDFKSLVIGASAFGFSIIAVMSPWIIRNFVTLKKFQPLSARYAEMPGEYVPKGYMKWVRTWIDNSKYENLALWTLDDREIDLGALPDKAFDSEEEKNRVADLLEKYNDNTEMTPELDQQFGQIADERIARHPFNYYFWVPAKRGVSLWFDTRTELLPINGVLLPIKQQINDAPIDFTIDFWMFLLNAGYIVLGIVGVYLMRKDRILILLTVLAIGIRTVYFASLENTECRYVLEVYPLLEAFTAIGLFAIWTRIQAGAKAPESVKPA